MLLLVCDIEIAQQFQIVRSLSLSFEHARRNSSSWQEGGTASLQKQAELIGYLFLIIINVQTRTVIP